MFLKGFRFSPWFYGGPNGLDQVGLTDYLVRRYAQRSVRSFSDKCYLVAKILNFFEVATRRGAEIAPSHCKAKFEAHLRLWLLTFFVGWGLRECLNLNQIKCLESFINF